MGAEAVLNGFQVVNAMQNISSRQVDAGSVQRGHLTAAARSGGTA